MKKIFTLLCSLVLLSLSFATSANDYRHSLPAVQGYDVVTYQTEKRPLRGNGHYVSEYDGASYVFVNETNKKVFDKNPGKYVPAYNGYCAYGVSVGKKFTGDPEVWKVVDGRLYLNLDTNIQNEWNKDISGHITSANNQWKKIEKKSPASL